MKSIPFGIEKIEAIGWAEPNGLTLDELVTELRRLGNQVLEIDPVGNRIKVLHQVEVFE